MSFTVAEFKPTTAEVNVRDDIERELSGVPRDGKQRPMVVLPGGGKPTALTRTTSFIDVIEDKSALSDWKARMALVGASKLHWLIDKVRELDPTVPADKKTLDGLVEKALKEAGAHDKRDKGTELHGYSELVDGGIPLPADLPEADVLDMAEYAMATMGMVFSHVETFVVVPKLKVGGTPDRIMRFDPDWPLEGITFPEGACRDDSFIFDLKTGTVEYGGLKMASQLATYAHAEFYDHTVCPAPQRLDPETGKNSKAWEAWKKAEVDPELAASAYSPIPPVNQQWGVVLNLPAGSSQATLYWTDLTLGWEAAQEAVTIRALRSRKGKALRPFTV